MKEFSIYGNCQSQVLVKTLSKNDIFNEVWHYKELKFVQNIQKNEVFMVENIFKSVDLLIYQIISEKYKIPTLSTQRLLTLRKKNTFNITFPSLYFNAYFPHLYGFKGVKSILNLVHDYVVMYSYAKGLNEKEIIGLMQNENLYPHNISTELLTESLETLRKREASLDTTVSDFIEQNYQDMKLFNHFNHPKGMIFDHIANQIFDLLSIPKTTMDSIDSKTGFDKINIPIYRSTYKNLNLKFKEDFDSYSTLEGILPIDQVVSGFIKTYKNFNREELIFTVKRNKPFIVDMFHELGI